jgi:2-keto-4-pentenoate hydratase/2-oxohepta-3-ene-1,7-dioic acid hydratase in catechol pathway
MAEPSSKKVKNDCFALRLVQFECNGVVKVGALTEKDGDVVDICSIDPSIPSTMKEFLEAGHTAMAAAEGALQSALQSKTNIVKKEDCVLRAPITNPPKIICIGMNYVDHCTEQNMPVPEEPVVFNKFPSAISDPFGDVVLDEETSELDFEVELTFVIGKRGKKISEGDAMSYVAGYTVAHDVSARDWQIKKNGGQWLIGKTFDTFCPIGPAIVTTGAISDPHKLGIRCRLNGETVQNSNTDQLVHKTEAIIAFCSR